MTAQSDCHSCHRRPLATSVQRRVCLQAAGHWCLIGALCERCVRELRRLEWFVLTIVPE